MFKKVLIKHKAKTNEKQTKNKQQNKQNQFIKTFLKKTAQNRHFKHKIDIYILLRIIVLP